MRVGAIDALTAEGDVGTGIVSEAEVSAMDEYLKVEVFWLIKHFIHTAIYHSH